MMCMTFLLYWSPQYSFWEKLMSFSFRISTKKYKPIPVGIKNRMHMVTSFCQIFIAFLSLPCSSIQFTLDQEYFFSIQQDQQFIFVSVNAENVIGADCHHIGRRGIDA